MVDRAMTMDRISYIRSSVKRLRELGTLSKEDFLRDQDSFAIAAFHLRRALEAVLDISRHIVASEALGTPNDYTEVVELLGRCEVLPYEFGERIRGMAGYRNRLVHVYWEISPEELYHIIGTQLDDFDEFVEYIVEYLDNEA